MPGGQVNCPQGGDREGEAGTWPGPCRSLLRAFLGLFSPEQISWLPSPPQRSDWQGGGHLEIPREDPSADSPWPPWGADGGPEMRPKWGWHLGLASHPEPPQTLRLLSQGPVALSCLRWATVEAVGAQWGQILR